MNNIIVLLGNYFDTYFSAKNVRKIELIILRLAVFSFLLHLALIFLGNNFLFFRNFQHSYLKAIYTPFSFILLYEVFLFVGKQFEVITLITLRSFFHDIAELDLKNSINIYNPDFISLMYDLCAALLMLGLTILYYKIYQNNGKAEVVNQLNNFINIKKMVSLGMIVILLLLSISSFYNWGSEMIIALQTDSNYPNSNAVFYSDFFSIMIFVDVLLLIISFTYHFSFFTIFRNASFIITTILIRMSLTIEKPMNYIIILIGFLFSITSFYLFGLRKKIGQ
jgi:hypothetical protein